MNDIQVKRFNLGIDCLAAAASLMIILYLFGVFYVQAWNMYCIILICFFTLQYLPDLIEPELAAWRRITSMLVMICGIAPHIYLLFNIERIRVLYGTAFTTWDIVFGTMAAVAVLLWVKRCFGWAMPIIAIVFVCYVLFGHLLPKDMMGHAYYSFGRFVSFNFGDAAMYGTLMAICTRIIFLYMLFGAFLNVSGVGDYLIKAALVVAGRFRGGPAKVAVISSALLGTINGNSVANVATTGAITIPLMKKTGYRSEFAGAVEAVASTGGQILPPVMGSGAFIMAEYLGIPYSSVALAAALPALLYYLAVFLQVDLVAVNTGLRGAEPSDLPKKKETLQKIYMLLPIVLMVVLLMVMRVSVTRAGLASILFTVVISWTQKEFRMGPRRIFEALAEGAKATVGIASVCMLAGMITGAVSSSGFATKFSSFILALANDQLILIGILTALICLVLGMGLPTTAAYIITASVALPALIKAGILPLAAHMFIFYYAILAAITPPVAGASYTGASIAKAPVMRTGLEAVKLGAVAYIMPFFFINNPNLIGQGSFVATLQAIVTSTFGCVLLAMCIQGVTFKGNKLTVIPRLLWAVAALGLVDPGMATDLIGVGLFAVGLCWNIIFIKFIKRAGDPGEKRKDGV